MSEYQRYEFIAIDRPLTKAQLEAVNDLSSHIEASSTHAIIEYNWGDFKHDPIKVLHKYFDGFLYWANWGSPQLALRFPHGALPADLIRGYDFGDFVTFTQHKDYDILNIEFGEMEAPDEWISYELGPLMPLRDELMEGDLRSLYIVWLASQLMGGGYDEDEDEDGDYEDEDEDYEVENEDEDEERGVPPVPPGFGTLTAAQQSLAELFRVPEELLVATAQHSDTAAPSAGDDVAAWVKLLSPERRDDYLLRLARNEPGLSRKLVLELRELGQGKTGATQPTGERVPYDILLAESKAIAARLEREEREREQAARQLHLQDIHDHQDNYWHQADLAAGRGTGPGYAEATRILVELREAADQFKETQTFQDRFLTWIQSHLRRPAFLKRLQARDFPMPLM